MHHKGTVEEQGAKSVQEVEFEKKKPQQAWDDYRKMTPERQQVMREIMRSKAWSLLHSHSAEGDEGTRKANRTKLEQQFRDAGVPPKPPKGGKETSGMRQRVQSAFA